MIMNRADIVLLFNCMTPLLIVVCSIFLSYTSLRRWLAEPYNHEQIFYWGISFAIIAFTFLNALLSLYTTIGIRNSLVMHVWIGIALWFQLFAIASVKNNQQTERKKLRLCMWVIFLIGVTALIVLATGRDEYQVLPMGLFEMQIIADRTLDLVFEWVYAAASLCILLYLAPIRNILYSYFSIYLAFLILLVSRLVNTLNIVIFCSCNFCLMMMEWALVIIAFCYLVVSVYRLIDETK